MEWQSVSIETLHDKIEDLCYILTELGVTGLEIEDEADFEDFLQNNTDKWDYVDDKLLSDKKGKTLVRVYLPDTTAGRDTFVIIKNKIASLAPSGEFGTLNITVESRNESEWENNWKQYFKPFKVGNTMTVKPMWDQSPDENEGVTVKIDPGMLFGTGLHATTRLCLAEIEKEDLKDKEIADLGCGSGILSAAALLYGAGHSFCADIDGNAPLVVKSNMDNNGIDPSRYEVRVGDITKDKNLFFENYDVIFANIVADVIISIAPTALKMLKKGGYMVTSGIIDTRKDEVLNALCTVGFEIEKVSEEDGWCMIRVKKG